MTLRAPFIVWLIATAVAAAPACLLADELLFSYEGDVHPSEKLGGWETYDPCTEFRMCAERLDAGHFVIEWLSLGGDAVNYNHDIAVAPEEPPGSLWVEWRFRSNQPFLPTEPSCDGRFVVHFRSVHELVRLHGDAVFSSGGSHSIVGLDLDEFYTCRFESPDGETFSFSVDGQIFNIGVDDQSSGISSLQFGGSGHCARPTGVVIRNEWDFVRYGTISDGEAIVGSDPPAGVIDAVVNPDLNRFTVTFDQAGYVYIDDVAVEVTGGDVPVVTKTGRLDNGGSETVEIVLDRPLTIGETTTFTFATGGTPNVVEYTLVLSGACCLPDGTCIETHPTDCADQAGGFTEDAACSTPRVCCLPEGECITIDPVCCTDEGGIPATPAVDCEEDQDDDGVDAACGDACPDDPNKTSPGQCGCGLLETDTDLDTVADCVDRCPGDDDRIDEDNNDVPDCLQFQAIPTASAWGQVILAFSLAVAAKIYFGCKLPCASATRGS